MKNEWFKELGWIYIPISWQGLLFTLLAFAFCLHVYYVVDMDADSVNQTLMGVFPYWVSAIGILFWIASKTTTKK